PWTTLTALCAQLGASAGSATYDYFGVNHVGWFYQIADQGRDLIADYAAGGTNSSFPPAELVNSYQAYPTKYLRLHFDSEKVQREQRASVRTRAEELQRISDEAIDVFETGSEAEIRPALMLRESPWYAHAVGPLLVA